MKSFDTDIKKYSTKTRMTAAERHDVRERLLSYMEYHPLPNGVRVEKEDPRHHFGQVSVAGVWGYVRVHAVRFSSAAFALLLVVAVPFAAERSLPGDALYVVKTHINEGLRNQLANSPYEKITLETELIERRVAEARLLASEGKLTTEVETQIAETVQKHTDAAQAGIAELREDSEEEAVIASITLDSALEVQSAVLDSDRAKNIHSGNDALAKVVRDAQVETSLVRGTTTISYSGFMARIEVETTRAYELFASITDSATVEEQARIQRRLTDVEREIAAIQVNADQSQENSEKLGVILGITQKLIAFMTQIDVRENVDLDTLVPIILTPEERTDILETFIAEIDLQHNTVKSAALVLDEGEFKEEVSEELSGINAQHARMKEELALGNITEAEQRADAVQARIAVLMARISADSEPEDAVGTTTEETATSTTATSTEDAVFDEATSTESEV